ncbi:conserved hypothetical protein [Ricinus communis]|uniref:Uncharacterized protein n=1 Tax=Ricinus communis TaxID=3988 RepID=B9S7C6_RICCO|nr:conserved hypothetical protein [Ricinus communis]
MAALIQPGKTSSPSPLPPRIMAAPLAPRWIPKRGQVLKNSLKNMFRLRFGKQSITALESSSTVCPR